MTKVTCPYCGKQTDEKVCPRCFAVIPQAEEKPTKTDASAKKGRKTTKEV